jgi:hypothetical protein
MWERSQMRILKRCRMSRGPQPIWSRDQMRDASNQTDVIWPEIDLLCVGGIPRKSNANQTQTKIAGDASQIGKQWRVESGG